MGTWRLISFWLSVLTMCVFIASISLSIYVTTQRIKKSLLDDIPINQDHRLLFSLSFSNKINALPLTLGQYYINKNTELTIGILLVEFQFFSLKSKRKASITQWKGKSLYNQKSNVNYMSLLDSYSVPSGQQCKEGYHQCGILDTLGNILCLESGQPCPINDIIMTHTNSVPDSFKNYTNYNMIQFDEKSFLYFTNEAVDKPVVVDFVLNKGYPCIYDNMEECEEKDKDPRLILLDEMPLSSLYFTNQLDLVDDDFRTLADLTGNIKLFYREYIGYDTECMKDNKKFWEKSKLFENYQGVIIVMLSFNILIFVEIILPLISYLRFKDKDDFDYSSRGISIVVWLVVGLSLLSFLYSVCLKGIEGCSDQYTDKLVKHVLNTKKNNEIILIFIIAINAVPSILYAIYFKLKSNERKKEKKKINQIVKFQQTKY